MSKTNNYTHASGSSRSHTGAEISGQMPSSSNVPPPPLPNSTSNKSE